MDYPPAMLWSPAPVALLLTALLGALHPDSTVSRGSGPPPAQDEVDEAVLVRQAVAVLRDARFGPEDRDDAIDRLLELGTAGPVALAEHMEGALAKHEKRASKARQRFLKDFDKAAAKYLSKRLDRDAQAAVEEARAVIRRHSVDPNLAKETIVAESDPAFARLEELLCVSVEQVFGWDEDLAEDHAALRESILAGAQLWTDWQRAEEALRAKGAEGRALADALDRPEATPPTKKEFGAELDRHAELARPMSKSDARVFASNAERAAEIDPLEYEGIRAMNLRLVLIGLPAMAIDVKLCAACRDHSKDMHEVGFFAHESPVPGKKTFGQRASNFGTSARAENIAAGHRDGPSAILGWWHSPGHHRNMLGGHSTVGLGRFEAHWTQNFN